MTRTRVVALIVVVPLTAFIAWIASHTYWADVQVQRPLKGEARVNPFYAAQRLAEALGVRTARDRALAIPSTDSVIVLGPWHWTISKSRSQALERWVESGGRLVVEGPLTGGEAEFERWSGIVREYIDPDDTKKRAVSRPHDSCDVFLEKRDGSASGESNPMRHVMCDLDPESFLTTDRPEAWTLRDDSGIQAMRVNVARGSVTVINGTSFRYWHLFDGDHAWLFVTATQLRRSDDVHFLSEGAQPSLLSLLWQHGGPVVLLTLALVSLALWRGGVRFGPLAAGPPAARRSLAEQIRGTGQFAFRHGGGDSLVAAAVRALDEAAQRRIPDYPRMSRQERVGAVARLTGFEPRALAAAVQHDSVRRSHDVRNTIALLEAARRQTLLERTRTSHGTS
jgi:hypothetical protein